MEKENGVYHIINRGNDRQDLFIDDGAHLLFENCLFETCEKCDWVLEGFCVMTNHFHLVVRTPKGNLIYGMKNDSEKKVPRYDGETLRKPTSCGSRKATKRWSFVNLLQK